MLNKTLSVLHATLHDLDILATLEVGWRAKLIALAVKVKPEVFRLIQAMVPYQFPRSTSKKVAPDDVLLRRGNGALLGRLPLRNRVVPTSYNNGTRLAVGWWAERWLSFTSVWGANLAVRRLCMPFCASVWGPRVYAGRSGLLTLVWGASLSIGRVCMLASTLS